METRAFAPLYAPTTGTSQGTLAASTTVTASAAAAASTQFSGGAYSSGFCQIQIANTTNQWAYCNFGNLNVAAVTAATVATGYPVAPGTVVVVSVASEVNGASVILGAAPGAATAVIFTRGEGL